ncbi:MAG TPA: hypothetical protein VNP04_00475 [Alphaproteobacteria bacterium]|nr:hypothetical protein [Alphaproteobacteria bacterium]
MKGRPAGVLVPQFLRYCIHDLKPFYYEALMAQRPTSSEPELPRWFWADTTIGHLIRAAAERMQASDDPTLKCMANGLAR